MYLRTTKRQNKDGSIVEYYQLAETRWDPIQRIRMKLSADSLHEDESFALVLQTVTEDLRRGPSFAHRLGRQTFGSLTGLLQEVVQFACRLKDGLEPARSQRLEMSGEFQETQLALVLPPQGRPRLRTQRIIQQK